MRRLIGLLLAFAASPVAGCEATDWLTLPLPTGNPIEVALETAYPGSDLEIGAGRFTTADGQVVVFAPAADVTPQERLKSATIGDQFYYRYPLDFDLTKRRTPWVDPGRHRNDALFRALWFSDKAAARHTLKQVHYPGGVRASFSMTTKHCVHAQLAAALDEIASHGAAMDRFLRKAGGSWNWRVIAGTKRLSAHSFGISVDFNTDLGGYWRWSGAKPGKAFEYNNNFPKELVQAMERYGFVWGGKWHHFDGMHFEYRPELILAARLPVSP